ncbi:glutaredoxin domain-containing protein [Bdellovibrionota bacterium FG-1]
MTQKVTVYTTTYCPFCVRAKDLLKRRGIAFEEILLNEDDDQVWDDLYARSQMKTVPQIFVNDKILGGFTELAAQDEKDQLASLK